MDFISICLFEFMRVEGLWISWNILTGAQAINFENLWVIRNILKVYSRLYFKCNVLASANLSAFDINFSFTQMCLKLIIQYCT
jgi:hypothetical protein